MIPRPLPRSALILAAGFGSRLQPEEGHKLLTTVGDRRLLDYHVDGFFRLGVRDLVVVTGYEAGPLQAAVAATPAPEGMVLRCAHNPTFQGQNGGSVLAGADALDPGPFWLTMSDHLFDPALYDDLARRWPHEAAPAWQGALMIDRKLDTIYDMPDATKVSLKGPFAIGKEIPTYDVIDVGLFYCDDGFVKALREEQARRGDSSTSDAVRALTALGQFGFWDIGPFLWQDVDTPGAHEHAESLPFLRALS